MGQMILRQALAQHLQCLGVHMKRLLVIDAVKPGLNGRSTASDADLEPAAAQLIEHADFLDQPQRRVQRQHVDHWTESHARGPLRNGSEKDTGRGRHAQRRTVMLGQVVAAESRLLRGHDQLQTILVETGQGLITPVEVIKNAKFHLALTTGCERRRQGVAWSMTDVAK